MYIPNLNEKQKFSHKFGHYFRTPLTYQEGASDIVGRIYEAVSNLGDKPIEFVYYWGAGLKSTPGVAEQSFISYLNAFASEFTKYLGKSSYYEVVILTDVHAKLNQIPSPIWAEYFSKVRSQFQRHNRSFIYSSELWNQGKRYIDREIRIADGFSRKRWHEEKIRPILENMSLKHFQGPPAQASLAAKRYYRINMIEKELVETLYSQHFFLSWNSPDLDILFPNKYPILHLHINKEESDADKPWFVLDSTG